MEMKDVKAITIPEGSVKKIEDSNGNIIWGSQDAFPYRRLEYVSCDGNCGINSGIKAATDSGNLNKFKIKFNASSPNYQQRIFANYTSGITNTRKYAVVIRETGGNYVISNTIANNWGGTTKCNANTDYVVESSMLYNDRYITINGTKTTLTSMTSDSGTKNQNYGLGAGFNNANTPKFENGFIGKIYGFSANRSGSNQMWYFIPGQRKSDGKVGFVRFKVSADGALSSVDFFSSEWTSEFTAGNITNEYLDITSIPSLGF